MKKYVFAFLFMIVSLQQAYTQCTANAGPNQILTCAITSVTLTGASNVPNALYAWSGPAGLTSTLQNPVVNQPGQYDLTVTDPSNGCTATSSTLVLMDITAPVVTVDPVVLSCQNPGVTLSIQVSPPNCVFSWIGPNGFTSQVQNPVVSTPGTYTVIATNTVNGCTATAVAVVPMVTDPVVVSASNSTAVGCTPTILNLMANSNLPGLTYQWSGPNNFLSAVQNPVIVNATTAHAGLYTVIVTDPTGCTGTAVTQVEYDASVPKANAVISNIDCLSNPLGDIDVTVNGGTPPYTYQWTGPNNFAVNTEDITNVAAGSYQLLVTDQTACSATYFFTIAQPSPIVLTASVTPVNCVGSNNGGAVITATGGVPPYTYLWSNGITTPVITNMPAGNYVITVADNLGCSATLVVVINAGTPPLLISANQVCENQLSVQVNGGTAPYAYAWSNGNTTPELTGITQGTYIITITDANGCTVVQSFSVTPSATPCTRIVGTVILDENHNCQIDAAETGLGGWFIQASSVNGNFYGLSDPSGHYELSVIPGDYAVKLLPQGYQPVICLDELHVILAQAGDSVEINYPVQLPNPDCPAMSVNLSTPNLRRCFNSAYYLNYCNNSPATATDVHVTLALDPLLSLVSSAKPYTSLGNNTYSFNLGEVDGFECGSFWVQVHVSCDAVLGQTHCSEAHIYPDTMCNPPNAQWSGALVDVHSVCDGDSLKFILKNIGDSDMTQPLDYIVIEDGIMTLQGESAPLIAGDSMVVSVPANGSTWYLEASQEPLAPASTYTALAVEGCSVTGTFTTGFLNQFALSEDEPWIDINCTANTGSYDPNDKQGFPAGYGPNHYIRPGTEIEYLIRFQNTGTDTAFNVVIRDTLSQWFDPATVQAGAASHPYRFKLDGQGILIFDFENILLPDSNVNEAASHGFVQFRIKPRHDVPLETDIPNNAAIYFDFNDPVITNTTVHRIGENFVTVGLWQPYDSQYKIQVAPHPVQEASWITLEGLSSAGSNYSAFHLCVYDATGRPVRRMESAAPRFLLNKNDLAAGIYFFTIEREGVLLGSGKMMVR